MPSPFAPLHGMRGNSGRGRRGTDPRRPQGAPTAAAARPASTAPDGPEGPAALTAPPFRPRLDLPLLAVCLLATALAFGPLLGAQFTTWDDLLTVVKNPWLRAPAGEAFTHFWAEPYMDLYVPVTYDGWALVASMSADDRETAAGTAGPLGPRPPLSPRPFHAANLALHLLSVCLVYGLLRRFFGPWPAAAGAALFGLHPVQVEPVAWVSGFKDVLCGALCLAALWADPLAGTADGAGSASAAPRAERRQRRRGREGRRGGTGRYVAATLLFSLAVLSKPTAMVLPAVVLALAWARRKRLDRAVWVRLAPWFAITLACMAWTSRFQGNPPFIDSPVLLRPLVALHALGFYAVKLLAPVQLAIDYGRSPTWLRHHPAAWLMGLIPLGLAAVLWRAWRRGGATVPVAAAAVAVIALAPVLGLVGFDFQFYSTVADHYLYLPMLGAALAAAWALAATARAAARRPAARLAAGGFVVLALAALGVRSWFQTRYWHDSRALYTHALDVNPDSIAALTAEVRFALDAKRPAEGEQYARRALAVRGDFPDAQVALGSALAMEGREDEAIEEFRRALRSSPDLTIALLNLGTALARRGRADEARELFARAVRVSPDDAKAHLDLGTALAQQHDAQAALRELATAVRLDPSDPEAHANYGWVLAAVGRRDQARQEFADALALDPNFAPAQAGLRHLQGGPR